MIKKLISASALVSSLFLISPVMAQSTSTAPTPPPATSTTAIDMSCVKNAIDKRDTAMIAAYDTLWATIKTALQTRRDALKMAWDMTDKSARNKAVADIWKAYNSAIKAARKAFKTARNTAWSQFSADRKACNLRGASQDASDKGHRGEDAD